MLHSRFKYSSVASVSAVFALSAFVADAAHAQFLRGLQDRLVNAVEERVEQNVEDRVVQELEASAGQAVDQSFNAMFGNPAAMPGSRGQAGASILSRMMDTSNITLEDEYSFDLAATFEMRSFDSSGTPSEPTAMVFHYAANAPYTGTRILSGEGASAGNAMIIYDFDNQVMLMLMDTDGSRFSMAYNWAIASAEWNTAWELSPDEAAASDLPQFERIGTRTINGYASEGYRTSSGNQVTEIWVSDEVAPGIERIFQANRTVPMLNASMPAGYPQGMIMELNSENTESGEKVQMRTISIDTDAEVSYQMSDYPLMSLGALAGSE